MNWILIIIAAVAFAIPGKPVCLVSEAPQEDIGRIFEIKLSEIGDQTVSLQRQLDSIPDGTVENPTIIKFPKGRFWTEGVGDFSKRIDHGIVTILNRKNLVIEAEGTILYTKAPAVPFGGSMAYGKYSHRRHFCIWDSENITVIGLRIEGSNDVEGRLRPFDSKAPEGYSAYQDYLEFEHAFDVKGGVNVTLKDCHAFGVWGDGFYVGARKQWSDDVKILNCSTEWNGRQGIAVANSAKDILIDGFRGKKVRRTFIDLEPHSKEGVIDGVVIRNSEGECHLTPFAAGGRGTINNVLIENNKYSGSSYSLYCRTSNPEDLIIRKNWVFRNNTRLGRRGGNGIKLGYMDNVVIKDNSDSYSGRYYVTALFVNHLIVKDNTVEGKAVVRAAGVEGLETDFAIFDNTAKIPPAQMEQYDLIRQNNNE